MNLTKPLFHKERVAQSKVVAVDDEAAVQPVAEALPAQAAQQAKPTAEAAALGSLMKATINSVVATVAPVIDTFKPNHASPYTHYWHMHPDCLQVSHMTKLNRFPKIFERAKILQPEPKRILSFGCSTGEECFTLAEIFPNSEIVGIDIDYSSVAYARKKNTNDRINFHTDLGATGTYDLAFCLMVFFCLEQRIPKERFQNNLKKIDKHLNDNALLMIYTSDYDPSEVLSEYDALNAWTRTHNVNNKDYYNGYYRKPSNLESKKIDKV